ncbi:Mur ligase domain-containing protein, partial [Streptococcus pneumoniae]
MRVHILGISGNGMRGIAEILKQQGHTVSGTDTGNSISKSEMRDLGFVIFDAHSPQNVKNVNLVIYSSAIANDNTEILEAHRLFIPVWSRMKAVNWLFSNKRNKIGV